MIKTLHVSPSIGAGNLLALKQEVEKIEQTQADSLHVDVMDGHFVPLLTIGSPMVSALKSVTALPLHVHIMVNNPDAVYEHYLEAGADVLSFHWEAARHPHRICKGIQSSHKKAGIALNPGTHWNQLEYLLPLLDQVVVMSVDPGFSRQSHLPLVHKKIRGLKQFKEENMLNFEIVVDGGVNAQNARLLLELGADTVVVGGAVFDSIDYVAAIAKIKHA